MSNNLRLVITIALLSFIGTSDCRAGNSSVYDALNSLCSNGIKAKHEIYTYYGFGYAYTEDAQAKIKNNALNFDMSLRCAYFTADDTPTFPEIQTCQNNSDWHCLSLADQSIGVLRVPRKLGVQTKWQYGEYQYSLGRKSIPELFSKTANIYIHASHFDVNSNQAFEPIRFTYFLDKKMRLVGFIKYVSVTDKNGIKSYIEYIYRTKDHGIPLLEN